MSDLRDRIAKALGSVDRHRTMSLHLLGRQADAVMAVVQPELDAKDAQIEQLREERDLAIAHDCQPYPTQWAYDQACKALETQRQRAEAAEERLRDQNGNQHGTQVAAREDPLSARPPVRRREPARPTQRRAGVSGLRQGTAETEGGMIASFGWWTL